MPDDTTSAIQALITQVSALTETVQAQDQRLIDLYKHNGRLLDKAMDDKRVAEIRTHDRNGKPFDAGYSAAAEDRQIAWEQAQADKQVAADKAKVETQNAAQTKALVDGAHYISRDDARNSALYRQAKETAARAGVQLRVGSNAEFTDMAVLPIDQSDQVQPSSVDMFEDNLNGVRWVRADLHKGSGNVRRALDAERKGLRLKTFTTINDLPENIRPKLALVEASMGGEK